jgi:GNAT superfamily N-acetyltransferase
MGNLGQQAVNTSPEVIERLSLVTWPGIGVLPLQGWLLRHANGKGHRPNSVATVDFTGSDLEKAVTEAERLYAGLGLRPMFHITPASKPEGLTQLLVMRGYQAEGRSLVYGASTEVVLAASSQGEVRFDACEDFARLVRLGSSSPEDGDERLEILRRITLPNACAVAARDGVGRACGHASAIEGIAAINLVRTDPDFRRIGLARQIMGGLAQWAKEQHCLAMTLCVEETNMAARRLYEKIGFEALYAYHYLAKA